MRLSTRRWIIPLVALAAAAVAATSWIMWAETPSRRVNMAEVATGGAGPPPGAVLRVAIATMISPKETEDSYFQLLRLVGGHAGRTVSFFQRKTYAEVNDLLQHHQIDLAFVCSGPYVEGHERFGMELLAVPVVHGGTTYHSYFIVRRDGPVKSLDELRGQRFAFVDPDSNTGYLVPAYVLSRMGESPKDFFGQTFFTHSHDNSIRAVADGLADGAAVDSLVWEYFNTTAPTDTARTRIIAKSPPYGIPPFVVNPALSPDLKQKLRDIFLHLNEDPQAVPLLKKLQIDRFVAGNDAMYDTVRQMQHDLENRH